MKGVEQLLLSFDHYWSEFSRAWDKAARKATPKSIHTLRISTRRVAATLQLFQMLSKTEDIARLRRRLKRCLKLTGRARDIQVELERVARIDALAKIGYKRSLEREERRETRNIRNELSRRAKRRFLEIVDDARGEMRDLFDTTDDQHVQRSLERNLRLHRAEFFRLRHRFRPADDETLHGMRIALKKWRYTAEAVSLLLTESSTIRPEDMRSLQKLMGDLRDLRILGADLEKWARKRGKQKAVQATLARLNRESRKLVEKTLETLSAFEAAAMPAQSAPVTEKTSAVMHREAGIATSRG